jgi:hypothetical protein
LPFLIISAVALLAVVTAVVVIRRGRRRHLSRWLFTYIREVPKRRSPRRGESVHLLLCVADHYEPRRGGVCALKARERVDRWLRDYPRLYGGFRDSDGRPPRHTFFYPMEKYDPEHLDALAELCRDGFGEVEIHLHHDGDTAENLRAQLLSYKRLLAQRHGLLSRDRQTGALAYGFIHGNWALDNSGPRGRHCGVQNELEVLRRTGCFADFTLPSAPMAAQTRKINSLYWAVGDPCRCKNHDRGLDVGRGPRPANGLLLIQGPLLLDWGRRKGGLFPRIENACLQHNQPPSMHRLDRWLTARVQVPTRPDWFFVKLHTHGAPEHNQAVVLGEPMVRLHQGLAERAKRDPAFHVHYVSAREMCNLVLAAEAGWTGSVAQARDYAYVWNGGCPRADPDPAAQMPAVC